MGLPPDWRQLSGLQRLRLNEIAVEAGEAGGWGQERLTALTSLSSLDLFHVWPMPGELPLRL